MNKIIQNIHTNRAPFGTQCEVILINYYHSLKIIAWITTPQFFWWHFFFDSCFGCATFLKFMHFIIFVYIYLNSSRYMKNSFFFLSARCFNNRMQSIHNSIVIVYKWYFFSCAINSIRLNAHAIDLMNSTTVCILFTHLPHSHSLIPFLRWLFVQIQRATDPSGITYIYWITIITKCFGCVECFWYFYGHTQIEREKEKKNKLWNTIEKIYGSI